MITVTNDRLNKYFFTQSGSTSWRIPSAAIARQKPVSFDSYRAFFPWLGFWLLDEFCFQTTREA